jgi:hypothetical protein
LSWRRAIIATVCLALALPLWPADAAARARSSGGYSRPSAPSVRTPSVRPPAVGGSVFGGPRTPSTSDGYTRPSSPSGAPARRAPSSPGDLDVSRRGAAEALQQYRAQQEQRRTPSVTPAPAPGGYARVPRIPRGEGSAPGWYAGRGWTPPPWSYATPRFGIWDALFLWFLLDTLSRPGHAQWFYDHQGDPGVRQWREEAQRQAQENAQLHARLDELDRQLAERQGQPRNPDYLPPDTPPGVAHASPAASPGTFAPGAVTTMLVLLGGAAFLFILWRRRRAARGSTGGDSPMTPLRTAGEMLRHKLTGEGYTPSRFRLGMTLTLDPTPFVLAAGSTKVPTPPAAGQTVSVQAVGTLRDGALLHRLYLDEPSFFQLHLGAAAIPDECRYFARIDQVTPADPNEWAFWLDETEGAIGWPQFQAKDGRLYDRVWSPGSARVPPRRLEETMTTAEGTQVRTLQAMLYAAPTGARPPAPATEYVLVAAVEAAGQAWIDICAGIDINPAALSLT